MDKEMLEIVSLIISVLTAIAATMAFILKIWNFSKQTPISLTLLTYEDIKKYRLIQYWILTFLLFGTSFLLCGEVGVLAGRCFAGVERYLLKLEFFVMIGFVVLLVVGIVLVIQIKNSEKMSPEIIVTKDKSRYWTLGNYLCMLLILIYSNLFMALFITKKEYVVINLFMSALFGIFGCNFLTKWKVDLGTEVARVKTIYKGQMVYLFRKQGDLFVAGDNVFEKACEEFFLLDGECVVKKNLRKVDCKGELYLKKENVSFEKELVLLKRKKKKEILRTIVLSGDAKEVDLNINTKITIVQIDKERICFRVNEQEELYEVKNEKIDYKVNDRNVLLI